LGVPFNLQRPFEQLRVVILEPGDLRLLAGGAEETGALHRYRKAGVGDDLLAAFAVTAVIRSKGLKSVPSYAARVFGIV
jgi:hypothetical protein